MQHQSTPPKKYIVRQMGREDYEFATSLDAVEHLISNPGVAKLFAGEELIMTKGNGFSHFDGE
jgi:hypothetical protein